jgi:hypothetical protein
MEKMFKFLQKMDRRIIFLAVFISIVLPLVPGMDFFQIPVKPQKEAKAVFEYIDGLNEGDAVLFDWAFEPSSKAELLPFGEAVLKHCFKKKLKVFIYYSYITGINLGKTAVKKITDMPEFSYLQEGVHYQQVEYIPISTDILIFQMMTDFKGALRKEGKIFDGIKTLRDIKYIVPISGTTYPYWYIDLQLRFRYKMAVTCTAVMGPDYVPYIQTGQLNGMINGLRGAADYEQMVHKKYHNSDKRYKTKYLGRANKGMGSLTLAHLVIFGFVGIGNLIYFYERKQKKSRR